MKFPVSAITFNNKKISAVGLGGFHQLEISGKISTAVIEKFLEYGGNYLETARGYGNGASEKKLGRALRGKRKEILLASKSAARDYDGLMREIDQTLKNLQTDYLDFYFFHNAFTEAITEIEKKGALKAMQELKEQGVIKGVGMSSHDIASYQIGMQRLPIDIILIWNNLLENSYLPEIDREIIPAARRKGIIVTGMKALADGFFYRHPEWHLRYAKERVDIVICGMNRPAHVTDACQAMNKGPLTTDEYKKYLRTSPEMGNYICRQCSVCPEKIKKIFRLEGMADRQMIDYLEHNPAELALRQKLAGWFALGEQARLHYRETGPDMKELRKAASQLKCPYNIDIERKLEYCRHKLTENLDPDTY